MSYSRGALLVVAAGYLVAAVLIVGRDGRAMAVYALSILLPLPFIWFPEAFGSYTGPADRGYINRPTPGVMIAIAGWFLLVVSPPVVIAAYSWAVEPRSLDQRRLRNRMRDKVMAKKLTVAGRVTVENVNVPGYTVTIDAAKYEAMRKAIVAALPRSAPGLTQAEIRQAVLEYLPEELFPKGAKAAWWAKMVQLDLEAKGIVVRESTKPLRWHSRTARKGKR